MAGKAIRKKTDIRKLHKATELNEVELIIWLQDWSDAYNVGGMFRVADACGASMLIMTGKTPVMPHPQIAVTSMGAHRKVASEYFERNDQAIAWLRERGYTLVAVEIAEDAKDFRTLEYPAKTCLVLGNEGAGVYGKVLKECDEAVFIPMAGKGRSLNVHVAAAIVAFQVMLATPEAGDFDATELDL